MRLSDGERQRMEKRLALRFAATGGGAQSWLERQLAALSPDCALLTRWCYSASPVSDWANYEFSLFRACAEHALRLREQSPLVRELPEPLFLEYVLHPRVNEEELCDCRSFFYTQIRERIEGLSAHDAILAINEWNAEQVCYRATDERTISALGAWRSGFGRCGEESTFAVNVLRAAGIPARQVYTPRWAHCDDNHAWVEAYCDGAWHFLGACEPEETLDRGWFTGAASRALLVHSRCFGTPAADEEIISEDGAVTFLNQTARYAPVRLLAVRVQEPDGRPAAGAEVTFGILNASEVFPAAVIRTDADGMARLHCGYGDLLVQARKNGLCRQTLCPASQTEPLELTLAEPEAPAGRWTSFTLHAPKERLPEHSAPTPAQRAAAAEKQAAADEKRRLRLEAAYDAARVRALRERFVYDAQAEAILRAACGNFAALAELLEDAAYAAPMKLALLRTLGEKDLRDVRPAVLREALDASSGISPSDEFAMQYLLCPRIGTEPLSCWRRTLADSFPEAQKREFREAPDALWHWLRETLRQAPQAEYRQLVTLPAGAMRLRCADLPSQRLLFAAICRTLGIPARLSPADGAAEYALDGQFYSPEAGRTASAQLQFQKHPGETWQPGADFGLAAFADGAWQPVTVPGQWDGARLTLPLHPGVYRVLTDSRLPNGDLHAMRMELRLEAGQTSCVQLQRQAISLAEQAVDFTLADFQAEAPDGHPATAAELTRTPALLMWLEEGREPTEHLLNELLSSRAQLAQLPLRLVFLLRGRQALQNEKLKAALAALARAEVWLTADSAEPAARSAYVEPDRLPLLLLCSGPHRIRYACAGYRIGSVDTALAFCRQNRPAPESIITTGRA